MNSTDLIIPYELRIGVAGHRELQDQAAVSAVVDDLIMRLDSYLKQHYSVPVEWNVISPLAKGADRIVARSIMRLANAELTVLTPFKIDEYRKDFVTPEDLSEFEAFFKKNPKLVELSPKEMNIHDASYRKTCYVDVGESVVDACEILIAVWDREVENTSVTTQVVDYARQQKKIILWINSRNPGAGVNIHIPGGEDEFISLTDISSPEFIFENVRQLAEFFEDQSIQSSTYKQALDDSRKQLSVKANEAGIDCQHLAPVLEKVVPYYVRADLLAIFYQKHYMLIIKSVYVLSALAVSVAVFQALFYPDMLWIIILEIIAMSGVLFSVTYGNRRKSHDKWLRYRHMAELLRVTMVTLLVSDDPCEPVADTHKTLVFYAGPESWLRAAVHKIVTGAKSPALSGIEFTPLKQYVIQGWIEDQKNFHENNSAKKHSLAHISHLAVLIVFFVTMAMAVLHFFGVGHHDRASIPILSIGNWITFLAISLPAWGAAIHAIGKQLEYERIEQRSNQMADVLTQYISKAEKATNLSELREVVHQAARVMSLENFEWWILLSFEEPEIAA